MRIFGIQFINNNQNNKSGVNFKSTRTITNTVSQLAKNNPYSLTEPNQRRITNAIKALAKVPGEKNIKFLLNTAAKSTYSTNIKLEDTPKNDWKSLLITAAASVLAITPILNKTEFAKKIDKINSANKLNNTEKEILDLRKNLLEKTDIEQIKRETVGGIKDFQRNLDYFIVSSETTQEHKKYVLERLNWFMSDEYKINPQLEDKKSVALAEMVNDMAIATPGHKIPNIKSVNQKQHGICAAISIVRKKLAYEDKPNYVDSIISELDNSEFIRVYDRSKLGSGEKINLYKVPVDFNAALAKGYRIIDASTTQWMQIAGKSGYSGLALNNYNPFDKDNFDVNADTFFNVKFEDPDLSVTQTYYQALLKAHEVLTDYKAAKIKKSVEKRDNYQNAGDRERTLKSALVTLRNYISSLSPNTDNKKICALSNSLLKLEKHYSDEIKNDNEYIFNEEESVKKDKIKKEILSYLPDAKINSENIDEVYDMLNFYNSNSVTGSTGKNREINKARNLYEIASVNRYQMLKGLEDTRTLDREMHKLGIQHREKLLVDTVNTLIKQIKSNSSNSDDIISNLESKLNINLNKKGSLKVLQDMKKNISEILNSEINEIYGSMLYPDKQSALIDYLDSIRISINNGNTKLRKIVTGSLGIKDTEFQADKKLKEIRKKLARGGEKGYNEAFHEIGTTTQIRFLRNMFDGFSEDIKNNNEELINQFVKANNLPAENNEQAILDKLNEIQTKIDNIDDAISGFVNLVRIENKEGQIIYTADARDIIMKDYENRGIITPQSNLKELQNHLDKIQKDRSSDEFNSRQGKLKDISLYNFSKQEKATMESVEKNLNKIHKHIQKELISVQQYIKEPLEELNREVGVNSGHWWVSEGSSGLNSGQEIRILEYITGRPHHKSSNLSSAIEQIKTTPYSGISSSSVFHDRVGMHAQYIADITPVKIKSVDENGQTREVEREILFQDNSWGASEHENVWTDSNGLVRTDYSDNRGGTLGYITNSQYRNGNFVDRILGEMVTEEEPEVVKSKLYKKLKRPDLFGYKAPQYSSIILDGKSPELKEIADNIHDTMFVPTSNLLNTLAPLIKGKSESELRSEISRFKNTDYNWENTYDSILQKIQSPETAIMSEEDYNKLPNNDPVKLILEKTAFVSSYNLTDLKTDIFKIRKIDELEQLKKVRKERAEADFAYSFGKDIKIIEYMISKLNGSNIKQLEDILKKYNIKLKEDDFIKMSENLKTEPKNFDGSLKHSINIIMKDFSKGIDSVISDNDARDELKHALRKQFKEKLYFNEKDLAEEKNVSDNGLRNIIKFIDRAYNPASDKEFIQIYRNLQNMPAKEFKDKVLPLVTEKDLGIKNLTGYDLLKQLRRYDETAEKNLRNTVYMQETADLKSKNNYETVYSYNKLTKTPKTLVKYDFEKTYNDLANDLALLKLPKLFDRYKGENLRNYGVYPAYPKIEYMPAEFFEEGFNLYIDNIPNIIQEMNQSKMLKSYYDLADKLQNYTKDLRPTNPLTKKQYKEINNLLSEVAMLTMEDESLKDIFNTTSDLLSLPSGSKYENYKTGIDTIISNASSIRNSYTPSYLYSTFLTNKKQLDKQVDMFVNTYIRDRYKKNVRKSINDYVQSLVKGSENSQERLDTVWTEFQKYNLLTAPEELLDRYIYSTASDSPYKDVNKNLTNLLKMTLFNAKLYDIQSTLMDAIKNGIETDVKSAFEKVNVEILGGEIPMSSSDLIYQIVTDLVMNSQNETALLFLEKFGLNETFVEYTAKTFKFKMLKNQIKKKAEIDKNFDDFINESKQITNDTIKKLEKCYISNPVVIIYNAKAEIENAAKKYSMKKQYVAPLLKAADYTVSEFLKGKKTENVAAMYTIMHAQAQEYVNNKKNEIDEQFNNFFESANLVMTLVNSIALNPNSNAYKELEEMNEKFKKIIEYQDSLTNLQEEK